MAEPLRKQRVVRFTRMVQDTIVDALQKVFTDQFREKMLRELHVVTEYPLDRQEFPSIIVDFEDDENRAAGVGHQEVFYDPNGILRVWDHRRFTGRINFRVYALSTEDRDIIYDALVETLSFGHLPTYSLQANLFARHTGTPDDPFDRFRALSQLFLNTDRMRSGGKGASPAPWDAEDDLVYNKTLVVECIGGFYNMIPEKTVPGTELITAVHYYPHMREVLSLPLYEEDGPYWDSPGDVFDEYTVEGSAAIAATEGVTNTQITGVEFEDGLLTVNGTGLLELDQDAFPFVVRYHSGGLIGIVSDVWLTFLVSEWTSTKIVVDYTGLPDLMTRIVSVSLGVMPTQVFKSFNNDANVVVALGTPSGAESYIPT